MCDPIRVDPELRAAANALTDGFDGLLDGLVSGHVYKPGERPAPPPQPGVYLFADGHRVVHVGRTRNLQARRRDQTAPLNDRYAATLAFRIAREMALEAHDHLPVSRSELERDPTFVPYFTESKAKMRTLGFRCVELEYPPRQAMLEIFASMALDLSPDLWRTH